MIKQILKMIWKKKSSNGLIFLEILLVFFVLFAAISFANYNIEKLNRPEGFKVEDVLIARLDYMRDRDSAEVADMLTILKSNLQQLDQVAAVGLADNHSLYSNGWSNDGGDENGFEMQARYVRADEDTDDALSMKVTEGRWFNTEDRYAKTVPIVVSQMFMEAYYPKTSMVDSIIHFNGSDKKIVGVTEAFRYNDPFEEGANDIIVYSPATERRMQTVYLKLKPGTPAKYEETINKTISEITKSKSFSINNAEKLRNRTANSTWIPIIAVLSICAFLCINISLGLFGVLWYNINRRRSEIGLRRAVGAHTTDISRQFILEILLLAGSAILIGSFFAIQIPLLNVIDLASYHFYTAIGVSALIIILLVLICAFMPSRQAARISPAVVLHEN